MLSCIKHFSEGDDGDAQPRKVSIFAKAILHSSKACSSSSIRSGFFVSCTQAPKCIPTALKPTALAALTLATIESSGLLQKKSQTKSSGPNSLASLIVIKLRFSSVMPYGHRLKSDTRSTLQFCSTGLREFSTNIWISPSIFFLKGPRTLKPAEVTTFAERSWAHSVRPFNDFSGLIS